MYSEKLQECMDVLFSFDMRNCQNCIFCANGRNLNYCIENKQYSKEEFEQKKSEILSTHENIEKAKEKYALMRSGALVKYATVNKCNKATGDYMFNCHDGVQIFDAFSTKNCSYIADADDVLDSHDCNNIYTKVERCYNVMGNLTSSDNICTVYPMYCTDLHYSDSCYNCISCFGCDGLNKKNYFILNKEYSKEKYFEIVKEIVDQLKQDGLYGEFFPAKLSPFGHNETLAQEYFPTTEESAVTRGFNWQKETSGTYGKETIKENEMPETIGELTEDILNQVMVCKDCKKNFRITKAEFEFYKRMKLPLPHKDFECRHQDRMKKRNPRKLWQRQCMCEKNHAHHTGKCENEFETSYAPDRPEIVYCEQCYQEEVA
jgi:hypothetical protein